MHYYGVTIGPIVETLAQASTPASLWYASYMFSELANQICRKLSGYEKVKIISPYYVSKGKEEKKTEKSTKVSCVGYGKYHDRILFTLNDSNLKDEIEKLFRYQENDDENPITTTLNKVSQDMSKDNKSSKKKNILFLQNYIQVKYVSIDSDDSMIKEKEGVINALNYYLDCLELRKPIFIRSEDKIDVKNPFQQLFYGEENSQNRNIKKSQYFKEITQNSRGVFTLLQKPDLRHKDDLEIRTLKNIAGYFLNENYASEGRKLLRRDRYFAIVQADGDNMGKYIKSLQKKFENDDEGLIQAMNNFSKNCFEYTTSSAEIIRKYGGTVIFAGGDDLLFLAPILKDGQKNIFTLLTEVSTKFNCIFKEAIEKQIDSKEESEKLALSFGVSICNEKFPLYEAFQIARNLLFGRAKKGLYKNNVAISLRKGNSVTIGVITKLDEEVYKRFCYLIYKYYSDCSENEIAQRKINSVIYLFENWGIMFSEAFQKGKKYLDNVFKNLFDQEFQKQYSETFLEDIKKFSRCVYCKSKEQLVKVICDSDKSNKNYAEQSIQSILAFLQIAKFLVEKEIQGECSNQEKRETSEEERRI